MHDYLHRASKTIMIGGRMSNYYNQKPENALSRRLFTPFVPIFYGLGCTCARTTRLASTCIHCCAIAAPIRACTSGAFPLLRRQFVLSTQKNLVRLPNRARSGIQTNVATVSFFFAVARLLKPATIEYVVEDKSKGMAGAAASVEDLLTLGDSVDVLQALLRPLVRGLAPLCYPRSTTRVAPIKVHSTYYSIYS